MKQTLSSLLFSFLQIVSCPSHKTGTEHSKKWMMFDWMSSPHWKSLTLINRNEPLKASQLPQKSMKNLSGNMIDFCMHEVSRVTLHETRNTPFFVLIVKSITEYSYSLVVNNVLIRFVGVSWMIRSISASAVFTLASFSLPESSVLLWLQVYFSR